MQEELTEDDKFEIMTAFSENVVPKLKKLNARIGTLNCAFAGPRFKNWLVHFREKRSDFEITEFEYDENSRDMDLKVRV
ncbi:MAG: hypothetical protein DRG82_16395 [Deltaproteobacteria bacterium]|nr:MAG: hypothetical protein DRG82_16395 [Deltaproteobacteria bacterium]